MRRKFLIAIAFISVFIGASLSALVFWPVPMTAENIEVSIQPGSSVREVAEQLSQAGVQVRIPLFVALARLSGQDRRLQAGGYAFEKGMNVWQIIVRLARGDQTERVLRIIDGWTFKQLREVLSRQPDLRHETLDWSNEAVLERLGIEASSPEGWFMPDTYLYAAGSSDLEVLRRAHEAQLAALNEAWQSRDPRLPLTQPYQLLILASLIEKETGQANDRALIGGVFINRLRKNMPLQTDPTIIYGLGSGFDGNLRKRDLLQDGPYNTYLRLGLPPTPIALPGRASLHSAAHPARHDYLYFVAKGAGFSEFSRTLEEHNRAVRRYLLKKA